MCVCVLGGGGGGVEVRGGVRSSTTASDRAKLVQVCHRPPQTYKLMKSALLICKSSSLLLLNNQINKY